MAHKTLIDSTAYEITGGVTLVDGTSYSIKNGKVLVDGTEYDVSFGPIYDPVFANNDWATIIHACESGAVPDTWAVGDQKAMTIDGVEYLIDIIGKNHDTYADGSGTAPLTLQMHECTYYFYSMHDSSSVTGWAGTYMRNTRLPAMLATMPSEVQAGIKKVTKAYYYNGSYSEAEDTLFLLALVEVAGGSSRSGEGSQYEYYAEDSTRRLKNRVGSSKGTWWFRTISTYNSSQYAGQSSSSATSISGSNPNSTNCISFAFCF